jgi:hypothetical protein
MTGTVLHPREMRTLRRLGTANGPNGTYEICVDEQGQPYVKSNQSGRKFFLTWETITQLAVENGVDEPAHTYEMQCEGGRFTDQGFKSVPFEH